MHATIANYKASPRPRRDVWLGLLCATLAVASMAWIVWLCAYWGIEYLGHYNARDCGTGRIGALGTVGLLPELTVLPLTAWWAATPFKWAVPVTRCCTVASGVASTLLALFVLGLEITR